MPVKKVSKKKSKTVGTAVEVDLSLPKEKSVPSSHIGDYTWLIYGEKKIGKSSLTAEFDQNFCMMFEPGGKALTAYQRPVPVWEHARKYIDLLIKEGQGNFRSVSVDTGQLAYDRCLEYVCKINGMQHPGGQNDYGLSWNKVKSEFEKQHTRLLSAGFGLIVVAHAKALKLETRSGFTYDVLRPAISGQAADYYTGVIDNIAFYHFEGGERFLQIRGDDYVTAGTRCQGNFLTTDGEPVCRIPMGNSAKEAYENLIKAFENKQKDPFIPTYLTKRKTALKRTTKKVVKS